MFIDAGTLAFEALQKETGVPSAERHGVSVFSIKIHGQTMNIFWEHDLEPWAVRIITDEFDYQTEPYTMQAPESPDAVGS